MTDILARQRQLIGTTAEFAADDIVLGNGEIAVERVSASVLKLKIGDGTKKFSALPYVTGGTAGAIAGGLSFKGVLDVAVSAPAAVAGDYYAAKADAAVHASFTGVTGNVSKGDIFLYDGTSWHAIAQEADLTKYLPLTGGTLTGMVHGDEFIEYKPSGVLAKNTTVQAKLRESVSVKDFGAVGDGVADDTAKVAAALASGNTIYVPDGYTFIVSGLTMSTANQRIHGTGTIKLKDSSNAAIINIKASGIRVEGITFDGNKANQSTTTDGLGEAVYIGDGLSNIAVRNCRVSNTKRSGIAGYGNSTNVLIEGNTITTPGFMGVYPSLASARPATRWKIFGNEINAPGQDGIGTVAITHSVISGNTVYFPTVAGIALEAKCDYTAVTGNTVQGKGAADVANGIQVNDSVSVSVTGNTVLGCGTGIIVSGGGNSHGVSVVGNTLSYCGAANGSITIDGHIALLSSFQNCYKYGATVQGNVISNSYTFGILINGVSGASVVGNQISEFASAATATTAGRFLAGIVLRNYACYNVINDNFIYDSTADAKRIGIFEVNDGNAVPSNNTIANNQILGLTQDICITFSGSNQSMVVRRQYTNAAPTAGTWARGQIQYHSFPASAGSIGWVSTDSRGGSFGSFSSTGTINTGTASLTLASTDGLFDGMSVTVAGAGPASAALNTVVAAVNRTTKVVTLGDKASTSVVAAAVTLYNPTFKTWGVIA